jgi:Fe-S cluster assembly protein SufD
MEMPTLANLNYNANIYEKHFDAAGAYINIPDNMIVETPIVILYATNHEQKSQPFIPHNHISLGKNSKAQIIEIYLNKQATPFLTSAQTTIQVQNNANLAYTLLQQANIGDQQNLTLQILQQANSQLNAQVFTHGGKTNHVVLKAILAGNNATCNINALEYGKQAETHALNLQIEHLHANSTSNVTIRSVLDDNAKGSLYGKILIPRNISKIKAKLQHKTMLLSEHAKIESKPQLEIYNDDVICSHGASIGRLDLDALLYMHSRGISTMEAKQLLLQSFIAPVIEAVQCINTKQQIKQLFFPKVAL